MWYGTLFCWWWVLAFSLRSLIRRQIRIPVILHAMGHPDTMAILGIIVIRTTIAGITMRLPTGLAGQIRIRTGKAESPGQGPLRLAGAWVACASEHMPGHKHIVSYTFITNTTKSACILHTLNTCASKTRFVPAG